MKTAKPLPSDLSSNRRAQPLRQTRNNPPRSLVAGSRQFGSRASLGGLDGPPSPDQAVEIFPAITHFSDAIAALPKELVRHFTLLKEVDAKIFQPEENLGFLVDAALNAPLPERKQAVETHRTLGPTSAPMSIQGSFNGSVANGHVGSVASIPDGVDGHNPANAAWDEANLPRRQLFQRVALTMQNMLVSLDEKNHVISTACEALNKQLSRIDDCYSHVENEFSEEARYGSLTHWAYPENRIPKAGSGGSSRRDLASVNNLSAAAQHLVDEAAARSDARKQALLAKKSHKHQAESDFDEHHDSKHKEKRLHGNSKIRKAADASLIGLGITNGAGTNGNPPKRRKVDKGPNGGAIMDRALSGVFGSNGVGSKKAASPRDTPPGDGPKKRQRGNGANGQTRKRNNTITSIMSPSIASSPIRSSFPDIKGRATPPVTNGGRPSTSKGRQNSTQSTVENGTRLSPPAALNKQNGSGVGTPDLGAVGGVTGRIIPEIKAPMKETVSNSKGERLLEDANQGDPGLVSGVVVGNRKEVLKREAENSVEPMQGIQTTTITTTKSGRASKPSTPAMSQFPDPVRSRSSRNALETASNNKRSHKKGAGAAAQQQLIAQQGRDEDDASSVQGDDEDDINPDEPRYCYCNGVSYGEMVGCDSETCEREWFHLECVGLKSAPSSKAKWYCDDCKEKIKSKRFSAR